MRHARRCFSRLSPFPHLLATLKKMRRYVHRLDQALPSSVSSSSGTSAYVFVVWLAGRSALCTSSVVFVFLRSCSRVASFTVHSFSASHGGVAAHIAWSIPLLNSLAICLFLCRPSAFLMSTHLTPVDRRPLLSVAWVYSTFLSSATFFLSNLSSVPWQNALILKNAIVFS